MDNFKIVIFIMAILISLTAIANKRKLPYPVLLVAAGLIIGFVPGLPELAMDPHVIFVIIIPPLLYDAASKTSWHEFRASIRPISALAITLVFFTTVTVAVAAYYMIPGFSWPLAFLLGVVVSPPDAVVASGMIKRLGLNKKVITILDGESLLNDATALIVYRFAVIAVSTGTFIFWKAGLQFLLVAGVGILIGVVIGFLFVLVQKKIENNPVVETSLTLLSPFVSYLAAEQFHMSGELAVISTGLIIAWKSHEVFSYKARMRTRAVWDTLMFLLHGFVFILIGLQLPSIIEDLGKYPFSQILGYGLVISLVTIVVRIIWVFAGAWMQNYFQKKKKSSVELSENDKPDDAWKNVLVVAWSGTRGVISLAMALAIPFLLADGSNFPKRHSIIFLAFVVIFVTLIVQGLSLPLLIRWLKIKPQDNTDAKQNELQLFLASSTLHFIEKELPVHLNDKSEAQLIKKYERIINDLTKEMHLHKKAKRNDEVKEVTAPDPLVNAKLEISKFQRALLLKIHKEGEFSDTVIRQVEKELDIDELKLNLQIPKEE
jgi:CPA1 family monovalent cation:H+ antiporter